MVLTKKQRKILIDFFVHPKSFVIFVYTRFITRFINDDEKYLRFLYWLEFGKYLNLNHPQTFQEKLQWLKLYNRQPEYTMMVDKYAVKKYVASVIGEEYIIPTLGVWDSFEEIDFSTLPGKFVLKCTHDSGRVVICKDKSKFDYNLARRRINKAMRTNYYLRSREWPYKDVKRRIIAEKFMEEAVRPTTTLADYKFFCFNGEPKYCQVIQDRDTKETIDFFDMEWNHQKFVGLNPAAGPAALCPQKPSNFSDMKRIAQDLSRDIPFSRIDLYEINDKTYFGEITLYPASGMSVFNPDEYGEILGKMIRLNGNEGGKFKIIKSSSNKDWKYMAVESDLKDYKIFCFNGKPYCIQVDFGRFTVHKRNIYDVDWHFLPFQNNADYPFDESHKIEKPEHLDTMLSIARKLSINIPHVRVDLYNISGKVYFGELTFFHGEGLTKFSPEKWAEKLGRMIQLPIDE